MEKFILQGGGIYYVAEQVNLSPFSGTNPFFLFILFLKFSYQFTVDTFKFTLYVFKIFLGDILFLPLPSLRLVVCLSPACPNSTKLHRSGQNQTLLCLPSARSAPLHKMATSAISKKPCLTFTGQTVGGISNKLRRSDRLTLVVHVFGILPFAAQNGLQSLN